MADWSWVGPAVMIAVAWPLLVMRLAGITDEPDHSKGNDDASSSL